MKKIIYSLLTIVLLVSCTSQKNSEDFIKSSSGRYLFNANEVLEIYFKEQVLFAKWRGNNQIELLKVNDSSFYMKELNEKIVFIHQPEIHIELAPKTEHKDVKYHFRKMNSGEKTPNEYFIANEFDKALIAFKKIKENDSLNQIVKESRINRLGYQFINKNNFDSAIEVFKINVVLYPNSSNVFDSLGEAYLLKKDSVNAETNFRKALSINPENKSAKRFLNKITRK
jgi:tetratricopeptide (TPR) repeat protein